MLELIAFVSLAFAAPASAAPVPPVVERRDDDGIRKKVFRFLRKQIRKMSDDDKREIVELGLEFFNSLPQDSKDKVAKSLQAEIMKLFAPKKKDK